MVVNGSTIIQRSFSSRLGVGNNAQGTETVFLYKFDRCYSKMSYNHSTHECVHKSTQRNYHPSRKLSLRTEERCWLTWYFTYRIELKKMERSYGLHLVFEQVPKLKHKSDGIIWTPVKCPYTPGTCEKL